MKKDGATSSKKTPTASPRAVQYVENLAKGMTKKDAALDAGYSDSVAENAKTKIENQTAVQQLLTDAGITHESLVQTLKEGMTATKLFGKEAIEHPDYKTRHQFMTTGFRLLGVETEKPNAVVNTQINIGDDSKTAQLNDAFVQFLGQYFGTRRTPQQGGGDTQ